MSTGVHRETAKIYQFPLTAIHRPSRFDKMWILEREAEAYSNSVVNECWYHEEAVRPADPIIKS
jgi:hypothetical protein